MDLVPSQRAASEVPARRIGIVARIGREEFAVILPGRRDEDRLHCESMRASVEVLPKEIPLAESIGIAQFRAGDKVSYLYACGDKALHAAKRVGVNRVATIE